jgi:hypothetical protein
MQETPIGNIQQETYRSVDITIENIVES